MLKDEESTPIDGAVGALIRFSFTFVFWSVAGIRLKKKKEQNNEIPNAKLLSKMKNTAHTEPVTI